MSASMKWRYLGHLQLVSKAVVVMAEMEVIPQEEIANPQGMKVFAVERPGLPEYFVSFPALCGVQSSPLVFASNLPFVRGPLPVLSTCPPHTNSGCGKERRIVIGPWWSAKAAPVRNYLEVYWPVPADSRQ